METGKRLKSHEKVTGVRLKSHEKVTGVRQVQTLDSDNKVAIISFVKKIVCSNNKWQQ